MGKYIKAELLKYRRSSIMKLIFLIPFLCTIVAIGFCAIGGEEVFALGSASAINHWSLLWFPTFIALLTGMMHSYEKKSTKYQLIFGSSSDYGQVWVAKCVTAGIYLLASSLILGVLLLLFDTMILGNPLFSGQMFHYFVALFLGMVVNLWQIPLYYALVQKIPMFVTVMLSCGICLTVSPILAPKSIWWSFPFSWGLRMESTIVGLNPNALPLMVGDKLWSTKGFGLVAMVSLLLLAVILFITTKIFKKRR